LSSKQLGFFADVTKLFTEEEIESHLADQEKFYRKYAIEEWLQHYHYLKRLSSVTQLPKITSVLSDAPKGDMSENRSMTEEYALKSVEAQDRLDYLHECVDRLPNELSEIIKKKFLERNEAGKKFNNNYIADVLGLSQATFYRLQNQALSELGEFLYQYHFTNDDGEDGND